MLSTQTRANDVPKHKNKWKEVHMHKIKGKLCCKEQEQRQMRLTSTRTMVNNIAKHKNKVKRGLEAYEQRQLRLLSTQIMANEVHKHMN